MGWFDEQIKTRKKYDDALLDATVAEIADAVMGRNLAASFYDDRRLTKDVLDEILKYFHLESQELPDQIEDMEDQMEYLFRPHGIMWRKVKLTKGWSKDAAGAMLGVRQDDGKVVALIPGKFDSYTIYDDVTGKRTIITKKNESIVEEDAIVFYRPLPLRKLTINDLTQFIRDAISYGDGVFILSATIIVVLIGMLVPYISKLLFSTVIDSNSIRFLFGAALFLIGTSFAQTVFNAIRILFVGRINTEIGLAFEASIMMRVLSLPAQFFRKFGSGDLAQRIEYLNGLSDAFVSVVFNSGLMSIISLTYIIQIFAFTPSLVIPALIIIFITVMYLCISTTMYMRVLKKTMEEQIKEENIAFAMISGIQKIKIAGAEKRAFSRWGSQYAKEISYTYDPPLVLKLQNTFNIVISFLGMYVMYGIAVDSNVSVSDYYAFSTAFGMVSAAFVSMTDVVMQLGQIGPILKMAKPILDEQPEVEKNKLVLDRISGQIEINNVSFRYGENMPLVLNNLSLKIRAGQYVAIVGKTGCGKSTLMRLLLGFEKPNKGAIYYGEKDISTVDLKSLRRKVGTVMQNGSLFEGDIFSNIVISAPTLTMDDAWEAAEMAGIANDIREMPMGMFTIVSEGGGGISGGQKQRIMIARAIASKPKVLMFDEATSALDNITQKQVSDALDGLKCTRIVIAHRLSTIRNCDRIIVLDNGKIIEDGTYDELIANDGFFRELVDRQQVNK